MATELDHTLFEPFEANACLIIHDVDEFAARLENSAPPALASWHYYHNPIQYLDLREQDPNHVNSPPISKDFLYAYQKEYRFLWAPGEEADLDEYLELELGSLEDIAMLYEPKK